MAKDSKIISSCCEKLWKQQYIMLELVWIYPSPIIGAIHSAWSAASIDMSKAWTAGLVLSATHKTPNGALIASCSLHRQVTIFQILWRSDFRPKAGSVITVTQWITNMAHLSAELCFRYGRRGWHTSLYLNGTLICSDEPTKRFPSLKHWWWGSVVNLG